MERIKTGCLFEKYWTKSTKKKASGDAVNPDSKSMQKLGVCSMIVEPHSFEVTLYTVRNTSLTFLPPVNQASIQRTTMSSGHYHSHIAPAQPSSKLDSRAIQPTLQSSGPPMPPVPSATAVSCPAIPNAIAPVVTPQSHSVSAATTSSSSSQNQRRPEQTPVKRPPAQTSTNSGQTPSQTPETPSSTNPVIQMLAQRASTDANLKSLMKLVANGSASETQLKAFQRHIDELNSLLKNTHQPTSQPSTLPTTTTHSDGQKTVPTAPPHIQAWPTQSRSAKQQEPLSQYYSQQPYYVKPKPSNAPRSDISAIVFDITGGNGDRYLLPKKSILQYLPGIPETLNSQVVNQQVLISFLAIRKGSEAHQGSYRSNTDYYQPLTIKLSYCNNKVFDSLAKVVDPPDVVRKYMEETMRKSKRAEIAYLVTRQPRATNDERGRDEDNSQENVKEAEVSYGPPDSLRPIRARSLNGI